VIDYILLQNDCVIRIAALPDNVDVILGYLVYQPGILHYVFVKEGFRKLGIAKDLVIQSDLKDDCKCTHKTEWVYKILRKYPDITYDPFILFKKEENYG
jgi:hypothetical protein